MTDWTDFLTQTKISDIVLEEVEASVEKPVPANLMRALRSTVRDAKALKELRATLKAMKPYLSKEMTGALREEIRVIADDLEYLRTDRGKTQLVLNRWLQPWYKARIRSDESFDDVMIGGDVEKPFCVLVVGTVALEADLQRLKAIVHAQEPPFPLEFRVACELEGETR